MSDTLTTLTDLTDLRTPDARLIRRAFTVAYDRAHSSPDSSRYLTARDHPTAIRDYVREHATDRRYSLFINAACTSFRSAIVTYRGSRYYVDHDYPTNTFRVTSANHS